LHNQVMELKGNIRVFCRVRPLLNEFGLVFKLDTIQFPADNDKKLEIWKESVITNKNGTGSMAANHAASTNAPVIPTHSFEFDKVFGPNSTQSEIFEELSQLVQSALDGYNICVFAYGQTGSGKTHTMEGEPDSNSPGMIELSARQIFESISALTADGWEWKITASFVEIYNETILDLLTKDQSKFNEPLEIRMVKGGSAKDVDVPNLTTVEVSSIDELKPLLDIARKNRTVASTKCNDHSSRSHSIFRLRLQGVNNARGTVSDGWLNLVDLAGSENLKKSESVGQQAEEAKNINLSLMTLKKVIKALTDGDTHIPYRESKLTYLLQNQLGGNCKTLMFVNINPEPDCVPESSRSLRFATEVNQCQLGTAKKNLPKTK